MEGELAAHDQGAPRAHRATSSSPTTRAATSPAPARSTTRSCSRTSTRIGYARLDRLRIQARDDHRRRAWAGARPPHRCTRSHRQRMTHPCANIGFIGLGIMGAPMAGHLHRGRPSRCSSTAVGSVPAALADERRHRLRQSREEVARASRHRLHRWCPTRRTSRTVLFGENGVAARADARARSSST